MAEFKIVQSEYRKLPTINFTGGLLQLGILNFILKVQRLFFRVHPSISMKVYKVPTGGGGSCKLIHFKSKTITDNQPSILYFHGGGFFLTYGIGHLQKAQYYAQNADVNVFFVTYRLSGKHPFPIPFEDSYAAFQWLEENTRALNISRKFIVAGDSAGGALAAVVAQKALDKKKNNIVGQMLFYPVIDCEMKTKSVNKYERTPVWNTHNNKVMWKTYLAKYPDGEIPLYSSPIHRQDFAGLPPAYIEVAEFDPLLDEGVDYADALRRNGVNVDLSIIKGGIHAFDFAPDCEPIRAAMLKRLSAIRKLTSNSISK